MGQELAQISDNHKPVTIKSFLQNSKNFPQLVLLSLIPRGVSSGLTERESGSRDDDMAVTATMLNGLT